MNDLFSIMNMQRLIHALIIFVFLVSCKTKNESSNLKDSIDTPSAAIKKSISAITNFDTIFASKAPKRITRNIKLDRGRKTINSSL